MNTFIIYLPRGYPHDHFTFTLVEKSDGAELRRLATAAGELQTAREGLQESLETQSPQPS